jgi:glutaredoxin-related protein
MKCLYSQFCPTTFVCSNIRCPNLLICKHTRSRHNRRHKLVAIRKTVANSLEFHRVREQRDKVYDQVKHHVGILHEYNKMVHKMIQL